MWWTAEQGQMVWHKWIGLSLIGLLIYRITWGLIGPVTARLSSLVSSPGRILNYAKSLRGPSHAPSFGHNPLGAISVLILLTLLVIQTTTGLVSIDVDGLASGWFGHLVSFDLGRSFSDVHDLSFNILVAFIVLHICAIGFYALIVRTDLITPMITGMQNQSETTEQHQSVRASLARVMVALAISIATVVLIGWFGR